MASLLFIYIGYLVRQHNVIGQINCSPKDWAVPVIGWGIHLSIQWR